MAQAKSLLLSDHYAPPGELHVAGAIIRSGGKPRFDEDRLAALARELGRSAPAGDGTGANLVVWAVLVALAALVAAVAHTYL